MDFSELKKKALEIKDKYHELETQKFGKKWTVEDQVAGFVVDVGELVELSMAKSELKKIDNLDKKIAHELADCLYSLIIIAYKYDVDLEESFINSMNELENKID